ncbi:MAG TPA: SRPBCC family protein [Sphingobacterium sp.]|nr:SRPBCC family protein [Sphingobacterium sp.]
MSETKITVETRVDTDIQTLWHVYTEPEHIVKWNFASDDWQCPSAENDLQTGGKYKARMEAIDGSFGFDFEATYEEVVPYQRIVYSMADGRKVISTFSESDGKATITTVFDAENENPIEMQRDGWQAILDNLKKYIQNDLVQ